MKNIYILLFMFISLGLTGQLIPKKILFEHFTQASCAPCAAQNPGFHALIDQPINDGKWITLKYQVSWPGYDPMNEQNPTEIAARVDYYKVSGVPTIVGNGKSLGQPGAVTQTYMNTESAKTTGLKITLDHNVSYNLDRVYITGVVENVNTASVTGSDFRLHIALVEHLIAFNDPPGSNGETEFRDVVRKLAYGPAGSPLSSGAITPGKKFPFTVAMAMPDYIYDPSTIAVVAFVQTTMNKTVHQSEISLPKALPNNPNFRDIALADLSEVPSLAKGFCANDVNPKVEITNQSKGDVTEVVIRTTFDGIGPITKDYTWTGTLAPGATTEFDMGITKAPGGTQTFSMQVVSVNGSRDINLLNNIIPGTTFFTMDSKGYSKVLNEDLENVTSAQFIPHTLEIEQAYNFMLPFSTAQMNAQFGSTSRAGAYEESDVLFWFLFWQVAYKGQQGILMYENLDFSTNPTPGLQFDYAYGQILGTENDQFIVETSVDCGKTWKQVWKKSGKALTTKTDLGNTTLPFVPLKEHWKTETVPMPALAGIDGATFRFRGVSANGDALYLDNIKLVTITGTNDTKSDNYKMTAGMDAFGTGFVETNIPAGELKNITFYNANGAIVNMPTKRINIGGFDYFEFEAPQSGVYMINGNTSNQLFSTKVIITK